MKYSEFEKLQSEQYEKLFRKAQVFWAFGEAQFKQQMEKYPLEEGFKYIPIGDGGYLPGQNEHIFIDELDEINAWKAEQFKSIDAEEAILYELGNHESFYTGELDPVIQLFKNIYSEEQVINTYRKHQKTI